MRREHFTDDRVCGNTDSPGFYLCGRAGCERARAKVEAEGGLGALKRYYITQRSKNDAIKREGAFLDGPPGTERELLQLRRQQASVAQMLRYASEPEKIASLQAKERDLQERVDRLAFPEHTPNASYYVWVLNHDGAPKDEGPYGPKELESAKTYARIAATKGAHDRAVSRGLDPQGEGFEIVRVYQRGTGERVQ